MFVSASVDNGLHFCDTSQQNILQNNCMPMPTIQLAQIKAWSFFKRPDMVGSFLHRSPEHGPQHLGNRLVCHGPAKAAGLREDESWQPHYAHLERPPLPQGWAAGTSAAPLAVPAVVETMPGVMHGTANTPGSTQPGIHELGCDTVQTPPRTAINSTY